MFVNTLAIRVQGAPTMSRRELVRLVNETMIGAFENQDYQFYDLVLSLARSHAPARRQSPVQRHVRASGHRIAATRIPGVRLVPYARASNVARVDLTIHMREQPTGLSGQIEYDNDLFDRETIESMRDRLLVPLLTRAAE
jgi:non-ribosomal peptide synthetase component F